jgi:dissimilatory sulfite reductase (desulfoviridin) alpha/beta subunit
MDPAELKKIGIIQQKQEGLYAMRIRAVGGDLTAQQLKKIAEVSEKYADGEVHLSTRQGVEIHNVKQVDLETAQKELKKAGIEMGACGPRVRVIVACPGAATCRWGIIDTKKLARELDAKYFRKETPHKFKIAVTGCPHNCAKATENDIGVMGGILPKWEKEKCINCDLCVNVCPTKAIYKEGGEYKLDKKRCILCPICTASCPTNSWAIAKKGYSLFIGGTMGKKPRLGTRVPGLIENKEKLMKLIERAVQFYKKHGRKKERFGHLIDRLGEKEVIKEISDGV